MSFLYCLFPHQIVNPTSPGTSLFGFTDCLASRVGLGFPGGSDGKECACNAGDASGFDPWAGIVPWSRTWQPTPVSLPGESHGHSSLVGYSPRDHKESDTTEHSQSRIWYTAYAQYMLSEETNKPDGVSKYRGHSNSSRPECPVGAASHGGSEQGWTRLTVNLGKISLGRRIRGACWRLGDPGVEMLCARQHHRGPELCPDQQSDYLTTSHVPAPRC